MDNLELNPEAIDLLKGVMLRKCIGAATVMLLVYDYAITCGDEFRYIWRKTGFNGVLGAYLFSRYFALIVQSINLILTFGIFSEPWTSPSLCKRWYIFQIAATATLLGILDFIVMLRIYALYNKSAKIGSLLVSLFLIKLLATVIYASRSLSVAEYNPLCGQIINLSIPLYGALVWTIHILLGVLTACRWRVLALGAPIAKVVTRDGVWVLSVICALSATIIRHALSMKVLQVENAFWWPTTFSSIVCCRIIMNMQTLDPDDSYEDNRSGGMFTSDIDLICTEQQELNYF